MARIHTESVGGFSFYYRNDDDDRRTRPRDYVTKMKYGRPVGYPPFKMTASWRPFQLVFIAQSNRRRCIRAVALVSNLVTWKRKEKNKGWRRFTTIYREKQDQFKSSDDDISNMNVDWNSPLLMGMHPSRLASSSSFHFDRPLLLTSFRSYQKLPRWFVQSIGDGTWAYKMWNSWREWRLIKRMDGWKSKSNRRMREWENNKR